MKNPYKEPYVSNTERLERLIELKDDHIAMLEGQLRNEKLKNSNLINLVRGCDDSSGKTEVR
tara:strand:+ start:49 stop:234 length:186 start_codon:yes stop_codon:yes gene_type:complete